MPERPPDVPGAITFVELVRLAVVVLTTGLAVRLASGLGADDPSRIAIPGIGAGIGYVLGGLAGRFVRRRVAAAEERLQAVPASEIAAGSVGVLVGLLGAAAVTWPVLLLPGKEFTVPVAVLVLTTAAWAGLRLGSSRGGDLLRFLGSGGRLPSNAAAAGSDYKLVDTSALIDGRLLGICQDGWLDGILLVPEFVLYELQGLADSGDATRRQRGQRGLDTLAALQRLSTVGVEVLEGPQGAPDVDVALLQVARKRGTPLVTTDVNLSRVAEVQGVDVRNVHRLADALRPSVLPGDRLDVRVTKPGREAGQGLGYLDDGTMVVVENAAGLLGRVLRVEVTGLMSNAHGRMLFSTIVPDPDRSPSAADGARPRLVRGEDAG